MRIYSIDLLKLIFAYVIAFAHMDIKLPGDAIAVDLFFAISGFFMAKKFYTKSYKKQDESYNHWQYTVDHIKRLYPHYIFSLGVLFCYIFGRDVWRIATNSANAGGLGDLVARVYELVPDILMVQNMGFFGNGGINGPAWQISVLVICGYFMYALMCRDEVLSTDIIFPMATMFILVYFGVGVDPFGVVGPFYHAMLRGFVSLTLGILAYKFSQSRQYRIAKSFKLPFNLVGLAMLVALFACGRHKNIYVIVFVLVILYLYDTECWVNKIIKSKLFAKAGDLSYAIYLNHALIIMAMRDIWSATGRVQDTAFAVIAFAVITVYSVFTMIVVNKLEAFAKKKFAERKVIE